MENGFVIPEPKMLAIGAVVVHAEEVCDAFDVGCTVSSEDFIDQVASTVYNLRKALYELKEIGDE